MTRSTLEVIDAHEADYEFEEARTYQRTPKPFRKRRTKSPRRRTAKLSMNGRNTTRSTNSSLARGKLAMDAMAKGA